MSKVYSQVFLTLKRFAINYVFPFRATSRTTIFYGHFFSNSIFIMQIRPSENCVDSNWTFLFERR